MIPPFYGNNVRMRRRYLRYDIAERRATVIDSNGLYTHSELLEHVNGLNRENFGAGGAAHAVYYVAETQGLIG